MMRWSAASRCDTQFPLQSRCCELPIVGSMMLSSCVAGSGTMGKLLLAGIALFLRQLLGTGPPSSLVALSPLMVTASSPHWSALTVSSPASPKMLPDMYPLGFPDISGPLLVQCVGCACALAFKFPLIYL